MSSVDQDFITIEVRKMQALQDANVHEIAKLKPGGELSRVIWSLLGGTLREAVMVTHIDTGSLQASHRMELDGWHGKIFIDPSTINPKSNTHPAVYGIYEHDRGGSHAFYDRAFGFAEQLADRLLQKYTRISWA